MAVGQGKHGGTRRQLALQWLQGCASCRSALTCTPTDCLCVQATKDKTGETWDHAKKQAYDQWKAGRGTAEQVGGRGWLVG